MPVDEAERFERRGGGSSPRPRPQQVVLSPPAREVRRAAGLQLTLEPEALFQSLAGGIGGAALVAILVGILPPERKFIGAVIGLGIGGILASTSPIGTIPQEIGIGATAASAAWIWWSIAGTG